MKRIIIIFLVCTKVLTCNGMEEDTTPRSNNCNTETMPKGLYKELEEQIESEEQEIKSSNNKQNTSRKKMPKKVLIPLKAKKINTKKSKNSKTKIMTGIEDYFKQEVKGTEIKKHKTKKKKNKKKKKKRN